MRSPSNGWPILRIFTVACCLVFWVPNSAQAQTPTPDYQKVWTTVGSGGTVDLADTGKVTFHGGTVQIGALVTTLPRTRPPRVSPPIQSAVIRYNVTAVDGLFSFLSGDANQAFQLTLRYLATEKGGVVARLVAVDLATGNEDGYLKADNLPATGTGYAVGSGACDPFFRFDFEKNAYYVEVILKNFAMSGSAAAVHMIQIQNNGCKFQRR